jgi:DNA polymerase-3 subunit delta'
VLAADPDAEARRRAFASVPHRLDGSGATVADLVDELQARVQAALAPLTAAQAAEVAALAAEAEQTGDRRSAARQKSMAERHRREVRRYRTDELRAGLAALAGAYRDELASGRFRDPAAAVAAVGRLHVALEALDRNPNETLLLQALLLDLPPA